MIKAPVAINSEGEIFYNDDKNIVKCINCNEVLANIVVSESNKIRQEKGLNTIRAKYKFNCYKCSGSSKETQVYEGSIYLNPPEGKLIFNLVDTSIDKDNVVFTHLKVMKL